LIAPRSACAKRSAASRDGCVKAEVERALLTHLRRAGFRHAQTTSLAILPVTQRGAMPDNTNLNPGDEAAPGTPGAGENLCPACNGSGKKDGERCEQCDGTGKIVEGIGGG
jgi:hypothetical protein